MRYLDGLFSTKHEHDRFRSVQIGRVAAVFAALAISAIGGASAAKAATFTLSDAFFADGTALTGGFTVDAYGYLGGPLTLTTSAGSGFSAFTFTQADPTSLNSPQDTILTVSKPNYDGYLQLEFANPLTVAGFDPLVLSQSYECSTYEQYDVHGNGYCGGTERFLAAQNGLGNTSGAAAAPEPASWALFGGALLALGVAVRRRQAA
jgi:hypothetical protein